MRAKNWPLILKVRDHILFHPEEHDQTDWIKLVGLVETTDRDGVVTRQAVSRHTVFPNECGTAACVAGWAAIFHGAEIPKSHVGSSWFVDKNTGKMAVIDGGLSGFANAVPIGEYAQRALGLTTTEAYDLFSPTLTREGIFEIIDGWYTEDYPEEGIPCP